MKKIAIIGVGRVGLPLALFLGSLGFNVIGIDKNKDLLKLLRTKKMPFDEPGFQNLLNDSTIEYSSDYSVVRDLDIIIITVGTPLRANVETDLSNVEAVLEATIDYIKAGQLIVLRSTVAPKTTHYVKNFIESRTDLKVGIDIGLAFCPERLAQHKALEELQTLPQIIGCEDAMSFKMASEVFSRFGVKLFETTYISAELVKLFNNSARYIECAIGNQFSLTANKLGQNIYEILRMANEDYPRGKIMTPGFTGGTCLRKDFGMVNELSPGPDLLLASWKVNEFMPYHITDLALQHVSLTHARIAILGYTFKRNSDDLRDSLVPKLIRYIERHIPASIKICEPHLKEKFIGKYDNVSMDIALNNADVIFIAVNHDQFRDRDKVLDLSNVGALIIDVWNCLEEGQTSRVVKDKEGMRIVGVV